MAVQKLVRATVKLPAGVVLEIQGHRLGFPGYKQFDEMVGDLLGTTKRVESNAPVELHLEMTGGAIKETSAALRKLADEIDA